jgi:hypothetical protein
MATGTTRRTADGSPVEWSEAIAQWARVGRPVLEHVAQTYGSYVTYQEMAELVQERAGITTGVPFRHWIGAVLGEVSRLERPDEPLLTSLVVRADGTIGDGYIIPIRERGEADPADLELHAATERLRCYRHYGAKVPPHGGQPVFTKTVAAKRASARPTKSRPVCPTCHLQLPASGVCDTCS